MTEPHHTPTDAVALLAAIIVVIGLVTWFLFGR